MPVTLEDLALLQTFSGAIKTIAETIDRTERLRSGATIHRDDEGHELVGDALLARKAEITQSQILKRAKGRAFSEGLLTNGKTIDPDVNIHAMTADDIERAIILKQQVETASGKVLHRNDFGLGFWLYLSEVPVRLHGRPPATPDRTVPATGNPFSWLRGLWK